MNSRVLSDALTKRRLAGMSDDEAGYDGLMPTAGNVRVTPGMVNGVSVNQRVNNALQAAGDLAGIGISITGSWAALISELQQETTLNRLKGALQEKWA